MSLKGKWKLVEMKTWFPKLDWALVGSCMTSYWGADKDQGDLEVPETHCVHWARGFAADGGMLIRSSRVSLQPGKDVPGRVVSAGVSLRKIWLLDTLCTSIPCTWENRCWGIGKIPSVHRAQDQNGPNTKADKMNLQQQAMGYLNSPKYQMAGFWAWDVAKSAVEADWL